MFFNKFFTKSAESPSTTKTTQKNDINQPEPPLIDFFENQTMADNKVLTSEDRDEVALAFTNSKPLFQSKSFAEIFGLADDEEKVDDPNKGLSQGEIMRLDYEKYVARQKALSRAQFGAG